MLMLLSTFMKTIFVYKIRKRYNVSNLFIIMLHSWCSALTTPHQQDRLPLKWKFTFLKRNYSFQRCFDIRKEVMLPRPWNSLLYYIDSHYFCYITNLRNVINSWKHEHCCLLRFCNWEINLSLQFDWADESPPSAMPVFFFLTTVANIILQIMNTITHMSSTVNNTCKQ